MYILLVDDNKELVLELANSFSKEHKVDCYDNYHDASSRVDYMDYGVVCLDIFLGDTLTGVDLCRKIRSKSKDTIIIMFSGEHLDSTLIGDMLEAGADSFVEKCSLSTNLVHKAIALVQEKKESKKAALSQKLSAKIYDKIKIIEEKRKILIDDKEIHVGNIPFAIFKMLYESPDTFIHTSSIIRQVKPAHSTTGISIKAHISNLRRALGNYESHIKNEWGGWYMFSTEITGGGN